MAEGHVGAGCCRSHSLRARRGWWTGQEGTRCPQAGPSGPPAGTDAAALGVPRQPQGWGPSVQPGCALGRGRAGRALNVSSRLATFPVGKKGKHVPTGTKARGLRVNGAPGEGTRWVGLGAVAGCPVGR